MEQEQDKDKDGRDSRNDTNGRISRNGKNATTVIMQEMVRIVC